VYCWVGRIGSALGGDKGEKNVRVVRVSIGGRTRGEIILWCALCASLREKGRERNSFSLCAYSI
jgi:hypothetical protein